MTEQELQQIEAAKAALDKATPGPWEVFFTGTIGKYVVEVSEKSVHKRIATTTQPNAILIAAAPVLVRRVQKLEDWQAKALPLLKTKAFDLQDDIEFVERVWKDEPKSNEWLYAQKWRKELEPINALIEQAEGSR